MRGFNTDLRLFRNIFEDIREQMIQNLAQVLRVSPDHNLLGNLQTDRITPYICRIKVLKYILHDARYRDSLTMSQGKLLRDNNSIQYPIDEANKFFMAL